MQSFLLHAGYGALILFAFLEAACIPIPSEVTFGFAGVLAYQGHLNLALVIILGTLAELAGSYVSYAAGRLGGRPLVDQLSGRGLDAYRRRVGFVFQAFHLLPVLTALDNVLAPVLPRSRWDARCRSCARSCRWCAASSRFRRWSSGC